MAACEVKVCRICFVMDCELHHLHENMKLYKGYEAVTELALSDEEDLPPYLCTSCADQLMNCVLFRHRSLQAHLMFLDILKNHGHISVESIQAIKTTDIDTDIEQTKERSFSDIKIEIKHEDVPTDAVAIELCDRMKVENMPDDVGAGDLVCDEAPCEVETNDVKEEVFEASVSGNVDDSKLGTGEDCLNNDLPSRQDLSNKVEAGDEALKYLNQMEVTQQNAEEGNNKLLQKVKLSSELCGYDNNSETQYLSPLRTHAKSTLYYCYMCDFKTVSKKKILAHMTLHSDDVSRSSKAGRKSYSSESSEINNLSKDLSCKISQESCSEDALDMAHAGDKPYSCDVCKKTFSVKKYMKKHMLIHSSNNPYTCGVCSKSYCQKSNFEYHLLTHSGDKPHRCDICNKAYRQKGYLQIHMLVHSGDKPYKCDVCKKTFRTKYTLQSHLPVHSSNKPYKCGVCKKSYCQKSYLQRHMLAHSGDKPYACDVCEKSFRSKSTLKNHVLIHSGDKPYKCEVCKKLYRQKAHLKSHSLVHTGDKPHKCDCCDEWFRSKSNLKKHLLKHRR